MLNLLNKQEILLVRRTPAQIVFREESPGLSNCLFTQLRVAKAIDNLNPRV